eukprot:767603-Hanusia_phi.AAC.9
MDSESKPHWKAALSFEEAREIYSKRPHGKSDSDTLLSSTMLSNQYKISPKAIRDIWNKRTWIKATQSMWTREELEIFMEKAKKRQAKKPGRPVGAKDTKPRKKKANQTKIDDHTGTHETQGEQGLGYFEFQTVPKPEDVVSLPSLNEDETLSTFSVGAYLEDDGEKKSPIPSNSCTICEALQVFGEVDPNQPPPPPNHGHIIQFFEHDQVFGDQLEEGEDPAISELRNFDINVGLPISFATDFMPACDF